MYRIDETIVHLCIYCKIFPAKRNCSVSDRLIEFVHLSAIVSFCINRSVCGSEPSWKVCFPTCESRFSHKISVPADCIPKRRATSRPIPPPLRPFKTRIHQGLPDAFAEKFLVGVKAGEFDRAFAVIPCSMLSVSALRNPRCWPSISAMRKMFSDRKTRPLPVRAERFLHIVGEVVRGVLWVVVKSVPECCVGQIGEHLGIFDYGLTDIISVILEQAGNRKINRDGTDKGISEKSYPFHPLIPVNFFLFPADYQLGDRLELHIRCALVDRADLRIAPEFLDRIILDVAVTAVKLDGF